MYKYQVGLILLLRLYLMTDRDILVIIYYYHQSQIVHMSALKAF